MFVFRFLVFNQSPISQSSNSADTWRRTQESANAKHCPGLQNSIHARKQANVTIKEGKYCSFPPAETFPTSVWGRQSGPVSCSRLQDQHLGEHQSTQPWQEQWCLLWEPRYSINYWCSVCGHQFKWVHLYVLLFAFIYAQRGEQVPRLRHVEKKDKEDDLTCQKVRKYESTVRAGEHMPYWDHIGMSEQGRTAIFCLTLVFKLYTGVRLTLRHRCRLHLKDCPPATKLLLFFFSFPTYIIQASLRRNLKNVFKKNNKSLQFSVIIAHKHSPNFVFPKKQI